MEKNIDVTRIEEIKQKSGNSVVQSLASEIIETEKLKAGSDDVNLALLELTKVLSNSSKGVDVAEIENIVNQRLSDYKIKVSNLSPDIVSQLSTSKPITTTITISTPQGTSTTTKEIDSEILFPLSQLLISDLQASNNVFLYGSAGTGKTYSAELISRFMGWNLIELECNQFTSKLDILGGQTIDGYQAGKLEMAWGNVDENGNKVDGCVLLLDEMPKLDPNTAGILNGALAKVKNRRVKNGIIVNPTIENGRNQKIEMGNIFIMATGNSKLNESNKDYEANFKQDLSLQDRFSGSTYEVFLNIEMVWTKIMLVNQVSRMAFLFIGLEKLRNAIIDNQFQSRAFVSARMFMSLRDTALVYMSDLKKIELNSEEASLFKSRKTIKQGLDSFLSLFSDDQVIILKEAMNYPEFVQKSAQKMKLGLDKMDTKEELEEVQTMIKAYVKFRDDNTI